MKRTLTFIVAITIATSVWAQHATTFVFVKITESIMPLQRGEKYEDPLDEALKKAGLGEVTGAGSMLTKEKTVEWIGLDVELTDPVTGIPFLRKKLTELGAPAGSVLEYERNGETLQVPVRD
ncbi:hypothetical protein PQU95_17050 [Vogesella sp. DC21W]|uniref:Uncharacterized protein n=1 Tax=Vogesella aquatica TaxID=2984206 RepID=A0ABT5J2B2_9NEIS|nr:hypothetical protein [Vogesella aquatica]MDC7718912.1 hypothetical protein [Vogesella aquatica]